MNTSLLGLILLIINILVSISSGNTETSEKVVISGTVELAPKSVSRSAGMYGRGRTTQGQQARSDIRQQVALWVTGINSSSNIQTEKPVLDQVDLQFVPQVILIPVNSEVRILNSDPVYHNVFSLSRTKRFDVGRRPKGDYLDVEFNREGIVDVFCDIHSNMHAVIIVMPEQTRKWKTLTNGEEFQINLPDGDYTLHIYASGYEKKEHNFTVSDGQNKNLGTIRLDS